MTNKYLIKLIQKYAQGIDDLDDGTKAAPAHAPVTSYSKEIQQMQFAMQKLSARISSTIDYPALQKALQPPPDPKNPPGAEIDKKQFQKIVSRDAFTNFMVNRYLRSSSVKGVEFDPNLKKSKMEEKDPSELKSMMVVLDTLRRIGAAKAEDTPDGKWGPRTNNALLNITAMAHSLIKLGDDLGMESQAFDTGKVAELGNLIPKSEEELRALPQPEKVKRSVEITKILNGIHALFLDFKNQVMENPNYAPYLDNPDEPIFDAGATKKKSIEYSNTGEQTIHSSLTTEGNKSKFTVAVATITIPPEYTAGTQIPNLTLTSADLVSKDAFDAWAKSNDSLKNLMATNPDTWKNVVTLILDSTKKQIEQKKKPSNVSETRA